jgi:hypothetical protein
LALMIQEVEVVGFGLWEVQSKVEIRHNSDTSKFDLNSAIVGKSLAFHWLNEISNTYPQDCVDKMPNKGTGLMKVLNEC